MNLNVAIIATWYPPVNGSFVEDQAIALSEYLTVEVFVIAFNILPYYKKEIRKGIIVHRIAFPYLPKRTNTTMNYWIKSAAKRCMRIINNKEYDIIHAHDYLAGFIALKINQTINIPYVVTMHNDNLLNYSFVKSYTNYIVNMLNNADHIICVGSKLLKSVKKLTLSENLNVIPNLVDTTKFIPSVDKNSGYHFIIIGDLDKRKGIKEILIAFSRLQKPNVFLNIVGQISDTDAKKYLSKNIIEHGKVSREFLPQILNQCHCLISFSTRETFGITVIEALSCGVPILYCPSGGPEEIVPSWGGIKVERKTIALEKGMRSMITSKNDYDALRLHKFAKQNYDNKIVANKIIAIYNTILKSD